MRSRRGRWRVRRGSCGGLGRRGRSGKGSNGRQRGGVSCSRGEAGVSTYGCDFFRRNPEGNPIEDGLENLRGVEFVEKEVAAFGEDEVGFVWGGEALEPLSGLFGGDEGVVAAVEEEDGGLDGRCSAGGTLHEAADSGGVADGVILDAVRGVEDVLLVMGVAREGDGFVFAVDEESGREDEAGEEGCEGLEE